MWDRYRKWKHVVMPSVVVLAGLLLGDPAEISWKSIVGMTFVAVLGLLYLIEEVVWIQKGKGRPCANCGEMVPIKAFRIAFRCPKCGGPIE